MSEASLRGGPSRVNEASLRAAVSGQWREGEGVSVRVLWVDFSYTFYVLRSFGFINVLLFCDIARRRLIRSRHLLPSCRLIYFITQIECFADSGVHISPQCLK